MRGKIERIHSATVPVRGQATSKVRWVSRTDRKRFGAHRHDGATNVDPAPDNCSHRRQPLESSSGSGAWRWPAGRRSGPLWPAGLCWRLRRSWWSRTRLANSRHRTATASQQSKAASTGAAGATAVWTRTPMSGSGCVRRRWSVRVEVPIRSRGSPANRREERFRSTAGWWPGLPAPRLRAR